MQSRGRAKGGCQRGQGKGTGYGYSQGGQEKTTYQGLVRGSWMEKGLDQGLQPGWTGKGMDQGHPGKGDKVLVPGSNQWQHYHVSYDHNNTRHKANIH